MRYCFLFEVTQVLYTVKPKAFVAVGLPKRLFGISTTMLSVFAPSKVSAASSGGKKPPGAESTAGFITALN